MLKLQVALFTIALVVIGSSPLLAHDGPDPVARWRFNERTVGFDKLNAAVVKAILGPDGHISGQHRVVGEAENARLHIAGERAVIQCGEDFASSKAYLPEKNLTVSAWVSIEKPQEWGGVVGMIQDNGNNESGWLLGYNEKAFTFALRGENGTGRLTYLASKTKYEPGKIYHVAGVYDGEVMQLYVNGKLESTSQEQSGKIVYPSTSPFVIGAYQDSDEFYSHQGELGEISIYDSVAKPTWVEHEFSHHAGLAVLPASVKAAPLEFVIKPYLQFGTKTSMTVMWRTSKPCIGTVLYGETNQTPTAIKDSAPTTIHELRIEGLSPQTQYFYRTQSTAEGEATTLKSDLATFQTAVNEETPFAFAVISDTQGNPKVAGQLASHAWGQRPSFLLHAGDLVDTGPRDDHWTKHFFPSLDPLIRNVPFYPVLGNHEQNAQNYFDYVSLPDPEYFYEFQFGNMHFFMIDSNRKVEPGSEQYEWLEQALKKSKATWKIVCHHHPPYSSDKNDYGDLWKTNKGTRGDMRVRLLVPLYEQYNVDIVWNGHIHSYERTWPVLKDQAVEEGAPFYMITGGGGGPLETPGPIRPFFQNTVRYGHHYTMVRVNGKTLEIQVYDLENRLFDQLKITK
ncbi:LamG-like jellyroll fold domain-containing protein [Lacunimicrobium album]